MAKTRLKPLWKQHTGRSIGESSSTDKVKCRDHTSASTSSSSSGPAGRDRHQNVIMHASINNGLVKRKKKRKVKRRKKSSGLHQRTDDSNKEVKRLRALQFLHDWHSNRDQWRFDGKMQAWLIKRMYDSKEITDDDFSIVVAYLEDLKGVARSNTAMIAEKVFKECEQNLEEEDEESHSSVAYVRSRQIIQLLV